jgi:MOSC domain-containing protein YiiM
VWRREKVFAIVLQEGMIHSGDKITVLPERRHDLP